MVDAPAEPCDPAGQDDAIDSGALTVAPSLLEPSSGLYAAPFFLATVSWRLITCRRVLRPLSVAIVEVVDGVPDGPIVSSDPNVVAAKVRDTLRTADIGARLHDGSYGLMLEDPPADGAVWAVHRLRRSLNGRPGHRPGRPGGVGRGAGRG